jgi:hypothetical protein
VRNGDQVAGGELLEFSFSICDWWMDEPCAVAQLEDAIIELTVFDLGQDPFQARKDGPTVGLAQCDHDDSAVAVELVRDGMEEIPIRGEEDGSMVLSSPQDLEIIDSLIAGSAKIKNLMPGCFENSDRLFREILVEQERHANAS